MTATTTSSIIPCDVLVELGDGLEDVGDIDAQFIQNGGEGNGLIVSGQAHHDGGVTAASGWITDNPHEEIT